jgi:hypothetical protein
VSRRRLSREQWRVWIAKQAESGQGVAAFCATNDLPQQSFYLWRRKLRAEPSSAGNGQAGIGQAGNGPAKISSAFVSVSVAGLAGVIVELPCGALIRVPPDDLVIGQVIDALLRNGGGR